MKTQTLIATLLLLSPLVNTTLAHTSPASPTSFVIEAQASQNDFSKIRAQLRAVKDEYIGEGETGEALDSLAEVNKLFAAAKSRFRAKNASATTQLEAKLKQLDSQIRASAKGPEVQKTLDEIERLLKTLER